MSRNKLLLKPLASARTADRLPSTARTSPLQRPPRPVAPYPGTTWGHSRYNAASSCASELLFVNALVGDTLLRGNALTVGADSIDVHRIESCRSQKGSGQGRSPA